MTAAFRCLASLYTPQVIPLTSHGQVHEEVILKRVFHMKRFSLGGLRSAMYLCPFQSEASVLRLAKS